MSEDRLRFFQEPRVSTRGCWLSTTEMAEGKLKKKNFNPWLAWNYHGMNSVADGMHIARIWNGDARMAHCIPPQNPIKIPQATGFNPWLDKI